MRPVEIDGWCTLYHADNAKIIDVLRGHAPDAVITDPPYGIGIDGAGSGRNQYNRIVPTLKNSWLREPAHGGSAIHGEKAGVSIQAWIDFAPNVIIWGADHMRSQIPDYGRFLAWDKLGGRKAFGDDYCDVEFAWHNRKSAARIISHLWKGALTEENGIRGKREHPMQKPIRVMEWCIEQCRLERGATILDPYMGSGTTAVAAFKRGMQFVGVEIDRRWFDVAVERIKRQTCDGPLFETRQEPEQVALFA